jgi:hypothetical protein
MQNHFIYYNFPNSAPGVFQASFQEAEEMVQHI